MAPKTPLKLFRFGSCIQARRRRVRREARLRSRDRRRQLDVERLRSLDADLASWVALGAQRRELAFNYECQGYSWQDQARAQGLPVDEAGLRMHNRCQAAIDKHELRKGVLAWEPPEAALGPMSSWREFSAMSGMPGGGFGACVTDVLTFPLTAAHAARLAGVAAGADGALTLLVLGAEVGSELSGPTAYCPLLASHWAVLLGGHGLGATELNVLFVGPEAPAGPRGAPIESSHEGACGTLHTCSVRGAWHEPAVQAAVPRRFARPGLAIAFNSGLAEHAPSWAPTVRALGGAGVPLAITSYHAAEAELDARSLVVRCGLDERGLRACMRPNRLASKLPHLDEIFPGVTYVANAYLSVWSPRW